MASVARFILGMDLICNFTNFFDLPSIIVSRDRFRTTVNVCGDCFGAGVVEHLSKKDLENHLEDQKENYQRQQKKEEKTELMNCNSLHVSENGQIDCRNDETKL